MMQHHRRSTLLPVAALATALSLALGAALLPASAQAAGQAPSDKVCTDKENPPTDRLVQGGCLAITTALGNCLSCHVIAGGSGPGNVAPPLVAMKQRFPDRAKLRDQIWDASKLNPNTVMPPFGRHRVLTEDQIDKIVDFILTL